MIVKGPRTNTIVISKVRLIVPTHFFLIVSIKHVDLLIDRDLIFKLE